MTYNLDVINTIVMSETEQLFKDITSRQEELTKLSEYLTELESQLSLIFAASPDMILFMHMDGSIVKLSQAAARILGYDQYEIKNKSIWDLMHPEDHDKSREVTKKIVAEKLLYFDKDDYFVNRWRKKDGTYAKLAWRFSMYDDNEDHIIGFATDISSINESNPFSYALLYKAITMSQEGIVITDMTEKDNPIIYVNPAFCNNTGYSSEELIGQNCRILQSDEKDQAALTTIRNAIAEGKSCEVLLKNFTKNKEVFYNYLTACAVGEPGNVTNYIGLSRNAIAQVLDGTYVWDKTSPRGFGKK